MKLRPYQQDALDQIKAHYAAGRKRVLLHLATGGGKTVIFCKVLKGAHDKNKKAILVVKGRELVKNASDRLTREGVPHGVKMANHWMNKPNSNVQVCSVDTLARRKETPEASLVVIDELQDAGSPSYHWLTENYPDAFILGVSATPHVKKGLKHVADHVVRPTTIKKLIDQGYLSKPRYYAPSKISVSGVKLDSTGDYNNKELYVAADHAGIYGDLVYNYKKYLKDQPAVVFAVNIAHSLKIKESFLSAGIACEHMEANTKSADRDAILKRLEIGETKVVTNVGILLVGVDMPYLKGVILSRPTKSYNLHIQSIGRGTRIYPGKTEFIVLDHAGNLDRHGVIELERECVLEGWAGKKKEVDTGGGLTTCDCYAVFSSLERYAEEYSENMQSYYNFIEDGLGDRIIKTKRLYFCPACGANCTPEKIERNTDEVEDELKELTTDQLFDIEVKAKIKELKIIRKAKGYKQGWVYHQLKTIYSEEVAGRYIKKRKVPDWLKYK